MQLLIGNKNYSSWSMRPWVLMRHFAIPFDEVMVRFDSMKTDSLFKRRVAELSPAGRVPVLVDEDLVVWDTLSIAEYLAEKFPEQAMWPRDMRQRARARSLCAELHAGFSALRSHCPQNIEASLPAVGKRIVAEQAGVRDDLQRIDAMWTQALRASSGPFLFGDFCNADASVARRVAFDAADRRSRCARWSGGFEDDGAVRLSIPIPRGDECRRRPAWCRRWP